MRKPFSFILSAFALLLSQGACKKPSSQSPESGQEVAADADQLAVENSYPTVCLELLTPEMDVSTYDFAEIGCSVYKGKDEKENLLRLTEEEVRARLMIPESLNVVESMNIVAHKAYFFGTFTLEFRNMDAADFEDVKEQIRFNADRNPASGNRFAKALNEFIAR